VRFGIARSGRVEIALFDIAGRLVRTLADLNFPAGEHSLTWDGRNSDGLPAARGVYFARIRTPGTGFEASRKLTLLQ
jgi:flagellar hook assembly protein FlgD